MRNLIVRVLDSRLTVDASCLLTLVLGLMFVFVWAPHPWGWTGIDYYHVLALELARGGSFSTTDVPWGYAYFLAFWYWLSGEQLWVPLVVQVIANASVPWLLYQLVAPLAGPRTAVVSAMLVGVLSFNTIYASTEASDAICTVLFMAALVCFVRGARTGKVVDFLVAGVFSGLAPQFRPNLILLPAVAVAWYLWRSPRGWRRTGLMAIYAAAAIVLLLPWTVRNYRLIGAVMPTSTHGGQQLWYGSLQVGPYLESRAYNPRKAFESAAFDYTSEAGKSIIITADLTGCSQRSRPSATLIYWTDRNAQHHRVSPRTERGGRLVFELPGQPDPTAVYYFFEGAWSDHPDRLPTPATGAAAPYVTFVSTDHFGDLDRHDDLLDLFDVIRLILALTGPEPASPASGLDVNADGTIDQRDLEAAIEILLPPRRGALPVDVQLASTELQAILRLPDESTLSVPHNFSGRQTDLAISGDLAEALAVQHRSRAMLAARQAPAPPVVCPVVDDVHVNDVYYRAEPHRLNRYTALAFDNISRAPIEFARASAYRFVRMFIIIGTDDVSTAQQFRSSRLAYGAGQALSTIYLAAFLGGVGIAWRRRSAVLGLLLPILYVPATICFVLTNMRYTVTMQPLMFAFVAVALVAWLRLDPPGGGRSPAAEDAA